MDALYYPPTDPKFNKWLNKRTKEQAIKRPDLFLHQCRVLSYMGADTPYRGVLLYHGLGVGKSRSAIEIMKANDDRDVVIFLPASLRVNFEGELVKANYKEKEKEKKQTIEYVNYNGLNQNNVNTKVPASLDGKLVIIDEVHNFISRVAGNGSIGKQVYQKLMDAQDMRIVCLSGTPVINRPFELGLLMNLIRGASFVHHFERLTEKQLAVANKKLQGKEGAIHKFDISLSNKTLDIELCQLGFTFVPSKNAFLRKEKTKEEEIDDIANKLGLSTTTHYKKVKRITFPNNAEDFDAYYVDEEGRRPKQSAALIEGMRGAVSFFETYDLENYPKKEPLKLVQMVMQKEQLVKYMNVRIAEIEKETKALKFNRGDEKEKKQSGSKYRIFSRSLCNFAFPKEIARPYPSNAKEFNANVDQLDIIEEDEEEKEEGEGDEDNEGEGEQTKKAKKSKKPKKEKTTKTNDYQNKIEQCLKQLKAKSSEYMTDAGLQNLGPKIGEIARRVESAPGPCLIYSVFRTVEGLKMIAFALEQRGFAELKVKKTNGLWSLVNARKYKKQPLFITFTENREETRILMNIYNCEYDLLPPEIRAQLETIGLPIASSSSSSSSSSSTSTSSSDLTNSSGTTKSTKSNKSTQQKTVVPYDLLQGGFVKALLITQSGAEGVSLKNTRQVHILEPYWNMVRIDQVIGRAVRARSHELLKPEDRVVETYLYEMVLNEKDANRPQINARDGGATSDGCVRLIAENKKELTDRFLLLAQQASIESGAEQSTTQTTTTTKDTKTIKTTKDTKTTKTTTRAPEPNATKRRVEFKINQISYFYVANPFGKEQNEIKEILRKNMPDKEFAKGETWTYVYDSKESKVPTFYGELNPTNHSELNIKNKRVNLIRATSVAEQPRLP